MRNVRATVHQNAWRATRVADEMAQALAHERIVFAGDPSGVGLQVAATLAASVGSLELLAVATEPARLELEHLAHRFNGLTPECTSLPTNHVADAIIDHVTAGPPALLVVESKALHPLHLHRPSDGNLARKVLERTYQPALVIGPHVEQHFHPQPGGLVVCVDTPDPFPGTVEAIARWERTFSPASAWIVEVVATTVDINGKGSRDVRRWRAELDDLMPAECEVLHGGDPIEWLDEFAAELPNPVYVTTSRRYSDRRRHLLSVTGNLIRRSRHPVLVVPDHGRCG